MTLVDAAPQVVLSDRAARRIGRILAKEPEGTVLRISVAGGGCSGFQYQLDLVETAQEGDLRVERDGFAVTLNFGNAPERLRIPFDAVRTFVDPSVEFGLRFETQDGDEDEEDGAAEAEEAPEAKAAMDVEPEPHGGAEVVSLDKWRK